MKKIKKALRLLGLILLMLLAITGAGFLFALQRPREQDIDNEIKTEVVEGKQDDIKPD